ncbi:hypothetical protein ACO0LG_16655 [Undibacterium sp. Ji42W]|uniref:hypothetical protein n=1 Tax=Undibacterium sp. Ji42W TaxID=3413039 RepID=UPI003BF0376E
MNERRLQSLVSFIIATLITALFLFQLVRPWYKKPAPATAYIGLDLSSLIVSIPKSIVKDDKPVSSATTATKKSERQVRPASTAPQRTQQIIGQPTPQVELQDAAKDFPVGQKSDAPATLNIGRDAVAKAYADSQSDMQKMPGHAGKTLETAEVSKNKKFGRAVSQAKIEDCIKPNPDGITIGITNFKGYFAAAALAYNAVTGQCK